MCNRRIYLASRKKKKNVMFFDPPFVAEVCFSLSCLIVSSSLGLNISVKRCAVEGDEHKWKAVKKKK